MEKQVENPLSSSIKAAKDEASPDARTDNQSRAYIMSLLKETKSEMTPAKPILMKVILKSILGKVKTFPKWHAPSVPSYVFPGTPSRRRQGETKTENKTWDPGGPSEQSPTLSHLNC